MIDLNLAAQKAIYGALSVPAVTNLSPVFQHVPDKQQPPVTIIGDLTATPAGGKDGGLDRIEFELISLVRAPSRTPLYSLMAAQRSVIEGQMLEAEGALLSAPVFEGSDDDLLDDGKTYLGTQRFSLFAQPSDD
jgi:uncharacterized protein DUF3168